MTEQKESSQDSTPIKSTSPLGKIKLCQPSQSGGSCPFHNWFYILVALLGITYSLYLADKEGFKTRTSSLGLQTVHSVFEFIDKYSPFNEFLESDEELVAKLKEQESKIEKSDLHESSERIFTSSELAKYDGKKGSPGTYLAFLGVVYDVSKGSQYYGEGGGYSFFSGRDASRAFVTGQFDEAGLIPNVEGLASSDYIGLEEWQQFYETDYTRLGLLEGHFYTRQGLPTDHWVQLQARISEAHQEQDKEDVEKAMFPPCNVEWTAATSSSRFWCTVKSGGVTRSWAGVPRQLFYPGRDKRCACVRTVGPPSTDPSDTGADRGDLDSPHVKPYPDCPEDSNQCVTKEK